MIVLSWPFGPLNVTLLLASVDAGEISADTDSSRPAAPGIEAARSVIAGLLPGGSIDSASDSV